MTTTIFHPGPEHSIDEARPAVFLAGPIQGDAVALTNSPWVVEPKRLIKRFGFEEVILLNDFEALSLSLADLAGGDLDFIGKGSAEPMRPRVVLGPGTGLGAAALIHARGIWIPVPGEGGHVDLAPVTERDFAIWPHIEKPGPGSISGETLLCGAGLVRLRGEPSDRDCQGPFRRRAGRVRHAVRERRHCGRARHQHFWPRARCAHGDQLCAPASP